MTSSRIFLSEEKDVRTLSRVRSGDSEEGGTFRSDTDDLPGGVTKALYVGIAGNVSLIMAEDPDAAPVTIPMLAGVVIPFAVRRIRSTGTTASSIIALY